VKAVLDNHEFYWGFSLFTANYISKFHVFFITVSDPDPASDPDPSIIEQK
jgi:hypothetical protein